MYLPTPKMLLLLTSLMLPLGGQVTAQEDPAALADALSPRVLFVTSGGYWEEIEERDAAAAPEAADQADGETSSELTEAVPPRRGYYRLIAIRGADNRSQVHLQHIALTPEGPELARSMGIDEINELGGYVTDIRPEDSTGATSQAGFAAYIYLKTDPTVAEPETWAVYIDEFGELQVERSSN